MLVLEASFYLGLRLLFWRLGDVGLATTVGVNCGLLDVVCQVLLVRLVVFVLFLLLFLTLVLCFFDLKFELPTVLRCFALTEVVRLLLLLR